MKKSREAESGAPAAPGAPAADYAVGLVSGSLFQQTSAASGSSLSALFSSAAPAPAPALLFQPAPKPVPKSTEPKEQQEVTPGVKGQPGQKKIREKSEADQKLEHREISLQNADEEERGQATAAMKKKQQRKRAAAAEEDEGNGAELRVAKKQRLRTQKEEEVAKNKRTVFVGNLPVGCTKKTLKSLFRGKGQIESIRFRSVVREDPAMSRKVAAIQRKIHPKKQSINAYVVFVDEDGVARALERNGTEIEKDFHVRVDRVRSGSDSSHDHKRSVFVGNLSFEITEVVLRRHFEECGPVEAVRLVRDQNSGLGKGFGYVLFESADSVQLALKLDGSKLEGRSVRVKRSLTKDKLKSKGAAGRPGRGPNKGPMKGPMKGSMKGPNKGPMKGPAKGPVKQRAGSRGGFEPQNKQRSSASFKGEMVDPNKKPKKKGQKKKPKPNKKVHI